jgi:hypothetical protein
MALKTGRGAAAPGFLVMDVIAAANARQAATPPGGARVLRLEVGQPGGAFSHITLATPSYVFF